MRDRCIHKLDTDIRKNVAGFGIILRFILANFSVKSNDDESRKKCDDRI